MNVTKEYKLGHGGNELFERVINAPTGLPITNWSMITNERYIVMMDAGRQKLIDDFKLLFNDLWHISPEQDFPALLVYYRRKIEFLSNNNNLVMSFGEFKKSFIQFIKEKHNL